MLNEDDTHWRRQKIYSIYFGCMDLIHHMYNQYKNSLVYVKCSYEPDPMVIFFQKVINSMKKLKVSVGVDFGSFWVWQGLGFRDLNI